MTLFIAANKFVNILPSKVLDALPYDDFQSEHDVHSHHKLLLLL